MYMHAYNTAINTAFNKLKVYTTLFALVPSLVVSATF